MTFLDIYKYKQKTEPYHTFLKYWAKFPSKIRPSIEVSHLLIANLPNCFWNWPNKIFSQQKMKVTIVFSITFYTRFHSNFIILKLVGRYGKPHGYRWCRDGTWSEPFILALVRTKTLPYENFQAKFQGQINSSADAQYHFVYKYIFCGRYLRKRM